MSYRVFSMLNTEPGCHDTGRRYLTVHEVTWRYGPVEWPIEDDVLYIEACPASPNGVGLEAALEDLERIAQAFEHPVMIRSEWQRYFDHSEKTNRENLARLTK